MITETVLRNAFISCLCCCSPKVWGWRVKFEAPLIYDLETGVRAA